MYTLLSSLANYGIQGTSLDEVNKWINSGLFSAKIANEAYDKHYISVRVVPGADLDLFNPNGGIKYIYISKSGLNVLYSYKQDANYGKTKWDPNARLKAFMKNYHPDDE